MNPTQFAQHGKRLPSWIYKTLAQGWIDEKFPRHLFIETTSLCNLKCSYCPREQRNSELPFSLFRQIIDEATSYGPRSFSLHLFGEPLLYSKWYEAICYIKSRERRHTVLFTTNGTHLNASVDKLLEANPDKVIWSWRPEAKFTEETKRKLKQWGKFQVRILKQVTPKRAWEEWKDWRPIEVKDLHSYGGNIDLSKFGAPNANDGQRHACYHLFLAPAVAWNGDILLCCNEPHHKEVIGKFPEMSIAEAWRSQALETKRKEHLAGEYKGVCSGCDSWKVYPDLFFKWQYKS